LAEGLKQRITTAIIIGIPILGMLFFSDVTRLIFLCLLIIATHTEFLILHRKKATDYNQQILGLIITVVLTLLVYQYKPSLFILGLALPISLYLLYFLFKSRNYGQGLSLVSAHFFSTIPIWTLIVLYPGPDFKYLLLGSILLIWVSDISAYFVGKSIGKRKLMPSVSPGKTREGFLGAGMCTILSSYILYAWLGHFSFSQWTGLGCIVWLLGSAGDLVESKMKRIIGIKDSGNILPGHGGFLDRFDGFIFCLPAVSLFIYLTSNA